MPDRPGRQSEIHQLRVRERGTTTRSGLNSRDRGAPQVLAVLQASFPSPILRLRSNPEDVPGTLLGTAASAERTQSCLTVDRDGSKGSSWTVTPSEDSRTTGDHSISGDNVETAWRWTDSVASPGRPGFEDGNRPLDRRSLRLSSSADAIL